MEATAPGVCPKCGDQQGYDKTLRVYGTVTNYCNGKGREVRTNGEDRLHYVEPKTVRCITCGARYPNPDLTAA